MGTKTGRRAADTSAGAPGRQAESFAVQLAAAVGYSVVVISVLITATATFSDDFGLGQAEALAGPVVLLSLWMIKRRGRGVTTVLPYGRTAGRDVDRPHP